MATYNRDLFNILIAERRRLGQNSSIKDSDLKGYTAEKLTPALLSKLNDEFKYTRADIKDIDATLILYQALDEEMEVQSDATPIFIVLASIFLLFSGLYLSIVFSPMLFIIPLVTIIAMTISPLCEKAPVHKPNVTQQLIINENSNLTNAINTQKNILQFIKANGRTPESSEELNKYLEEIKNTSSSEIRKEPGKLATHPALVEANGKGRDLGEGLENTP